MTSQNTFQEQLIDYLGGTTGGSLGPGVTDSSLRGTKSDGFFVNFSEGVGNECDIGFEMVAQPSSGLAYIDVHTTPGYFNNDADFRMIFGGGATGTSFQAGMNTQGAGITMFHPIRLNPVGAGLPPPWFADYGITNATAGANALTTITFNTTFQVAPTIQLTLFDTNPGGGGQAAITAYVEAITTTTASVRGFGTMGADMQWMWFVIGGVAP